MIDFKNAIVLDFEVFHSREYKMGKGKLSTEEYIRGAKYQSLVLALTPDDPVVNHPIEVVCGPDAIATRITAIDWPATTVIMHNANFDAGILSVRYNAHPARIVCTLAMARGLWGPDDVDGASLEDLAAKFGLPPKTVPYSDFMGKRFEELDAATVNALAAGCQNDVALTREVARRMLREFPECELDIVDQTCRMFTEPALIGDERYLRGLVIMEKTRKTYVKKRLGVTAKELRSGKRFVGCA